MKNIIGSGLFVLLLFIRNVHAETLSLRVTTQQGIPLTAIAVGVPFSLIITVEKSEDIRSWPTIEGLRGFVSLGQRSDVSVVVNNNERKNERRFIYTLQAREQGEFTLGPARFEGSSLGESNTVSIKVIGATVSKTPGSYKPPTYEFNVARKSAVVGEKVPFIARFRYQDPDIALSNVEVPQMAGVRVDPLKEGTAQMIQSNNELYWQIEYTGALYAQKAGVLTFGRLRAEYTQKRHNHNNNNVWDVFFGLGMRNQPLVVFSQPTVLTVDDIPPSPIPVQAVGKFNSFNLGAASKAGPAWRSPERGAYS